MRIVIEILAAVLNSLWQAALVAGVVWLTLRLLRGPFINPLNAATRYAIWWAVLVVTLALPAAPTVMAWWHARTPQAPGANAKAPAPHPNIAPLVEEQPAIVTLREERAARWPAWVLAIWAALGLYRLFQIGRSYLYLRGVKRRASASLAALPRIGRRARLLLSSDVSSPMAVGFLHPAVILPESLPGELAQPEMEHVLLHEAAHIARKDDWTNLLARLLGAALALHPVAWWILRQIEREREVACDDWVVARTGSARPYAQSLARMSELRWSRQTSQGKTPGATQGEALASGISGGGSRLGERIERLLERERVFSPRMSKTRVAVSAVALLGCVIVGSLAPRLIAFAEERPSFEVATIKPSDPQHVGAQMFSPGPGRFTAMTATLKDLVAWAHGVRRFQVLGGPGWFDSDHYDITAKADGATTHSTLRSMTQALLEQRCQLKLHRETKDLPIYDLVVGKNGSKLRQVDSPGLGVGFSRGLLNGKGADMATFAQVLSDQVDRVVVDQTGLSGFYEFTLTWTPDEAQLAEDPGPSLFSALQEQLGLKLEPAKGPVEILVIDNVEKPDAN
jgi:uncharacterized protein (TIGR03435 family)